MIQKHRKPNAKKKICMSSHALSVESKEETEVLIKKAINFLTRNKTSIIIAHRLSTIKNADKFIFLKEGRVMEKGTHEELIKLKGFLIRQSNVKRLSNRCLMSRVRMWVICFIT